MTRTMTFLGAAALALGLVACQSGDVSADYSSEGTGVAPDVLTADLPKAPTFTLQDTNGETHSLDDYLGKDQLVVLEWFNPDCPYVQAYHEDNSRMADVYEQLGTDKVAWLAINSGAPGKQGAGLDRNKKAAADYDVPYPILLDESGEVGKQYKARTTPHMFVIAPNGGILYAGAIDDSNGRGEPKRNLVIAAIEDYRAGKPVSTPASKPFGCSVKYAD